MPNVDPNAPASERAATLRGIIDQVVVDLDVNPLVNVKRFLLHVGWYEGARLTARAQIGGGPGRSFFQFEPPRAKDGVGWAVQKGWVDRLASASGLSEQQTIDAAAALTGGEWPAGNKIESALLASDLFGTYLIRIVLRRIPEAVPKANADQAIYWADYWKVSFDNGEQRAAQIAAFTEAANEADAP